MKAALILCLTYSTAAFGALTPKEIEYLLLSDRDTRDSHLAFEAKVQSLSKEDLFQWVDLVKTQDIPVALRRVVYLAERKYEEFEGDFTDEEKSRVARLMIQGVEKVIEQTQEYGILSFLTAVDHPLVDELIERLKQVKDEGCVRNLNILVLGIAETRSKKAAASRPFSVEESAAGLPEPIKAPGATAKESESKPASKALANSVWSKWRWALIGTIAAAVILWLTLKRRP